MKILKSIPLILISFLAFSCNNTSAHDAEHNEETIEFNEGLKWKVNTEMTPYILTGEQLLTDYDNGDYKALAQQLKDENNGLIKSCTMEGQSHDELHKWLHPHLVLVDALSKAESEEKANEIINELTESFEIYHTYFQ